MKISKIFPGGLMKVEFVIVKELIFPPRAIDLSTETSIEKSLTTLFYTIIQSSFYGVAFSGLCGSVVEIKFLSQIKVIIFATALFSALSIKFGLKSFNALDKRLIKPLERNFFNNIILGLIVGACMFQSIEGTLPNKDSLLSKGLASIVMLTTGIIFGALSEVNIHLVESRIDPEYNRQGAKHIIKENASLLLGYRKEISKDNFLLLRQQFIQKVSKIE